MVDILGTVITKQSSSKSLLTGEKMRAKPQLWTDKRKAETSGFSGFTVSKGPWENVFAVLITFQTSPFMGTGTGNSHLLEVNQVRQKAGLAEQGSSLGYKGKKRKVYTQFKK